MSKSIRIAMAGVPRAGSFFNAFQSHAETEIVALCDVDAAALSAAGKSTGIDARYLIYEQMLDEVKPDAVVIATPMHFHAAQAMAALGRDIHVLSEVTAAVSMDEARWLVDACARSKAVYMMAENYLYNRTNALVKNMVDAGLFGEIYYAEGEYLHELSALHHMPDGSPTWRAYWQVGVNGCTYPTHSLGPCLEWVGERAARVSCIGTGRRTDPEHAMEDTVLLLCKTDSGKLIRVRLDMLSKRPHAMTNYTLQGTKGAYESARRSGEGDWVWVEDRCQDPHQWTPLESFAGDYLPEIWRNLPGQARQSGHGGGDYLVALDFVDAIQGRKAPRVGIHEAMDMTLPGLVSQTSIARGGEWLDVPDSRSWPG